MCQKGKIMIIKIQNTAIINAIGESTHGSRKPVMCLSDGKVYASATDAAEEIGVTPNMMSTVCLGKAKTCKGKQYCYVANIGEHLNTLMENVRKLSIKAQVYDVQEATKAAEAERKATIIKLEEQLAKDKARIAATETKLLSLKGEPISVAL